MSDSWLNTFSLRPEPSSRSSTPQLGGYFQNVYEDNRLQLSPDISYCPIPSLSLRTTCIHSRRPRFTAKLLRLLRLITLRRVLQFVLCVSLVFVLAVLSFGIPPSYKDIRAFERRLPQQHWNSHPEPVGSSEGRYLKFPDHIWGHGFNNILQEVCVYSSARPVKLNI